MSRRETKHRKLNKISVGDMRERITLYSITLRSSTSRTSHNQRHVTTDIDTVWCSINSLTSLYSGYTDFKGVNIDDKRPTHEIWIRYDEDLSISHDIRLRDENNIAYEILKFEIPENRNQYYKLSCKRLGDFDNEVNK